MASFAASPISDLASCPPSLRCKYGFLIQVLGVAFEGERDLAGLDTAILAAVPEGQLPHFREFTLEHALQPGYDFGDEFDAGLELILEGLADRLAAEQS